jgi:hypothetical protein
MKKLSCYFIYLLSIILCFPGPVLAQNNLKHPSFDIHKDYHLSMRNISVLNSPLRMGDLITSPENLNIKCIRDFHVRYNHVDSSLWFATPRGYLVYFIQGEFGNRAIYDKTGSWEYSIILCDENSLPKEIRATVKSVYYDMTIENIEEIQSFEGVSYFITLQDKFSIKVVKINEETGMTIVQDLKR